MKSLMGEVGTPKPTEYRLLRLDGVKERTGLSRSLIYQLVGEGRFPEQIHLGARSVAWIEAEVEDWIRQKIRESRSQI
ncbi:AlpA family transcriptional regulator [Ferrovum sp.]|uniref:helix-turn-helix transcriptional regulator n=1 Tax=Ferrovum sp. TaxID=2609467 RepID=UPI002623A9B1|nr:AlpA family transcriptional regulator [Ferrovum sp.]